MLKKIMAILLAAVSPFSLAHHSFVAVFDPAQPIELHGTVTSVDWMNPHVWFYIDVVNAAGEVENWGFEMGSPNSLFRRGWSHLTLEKGAEITVSGVKARDNTNRAAVRSVTLASGESLFGAQNESR